jgi:hypothetical protein
MQSKELFGPAKTSAVVNGSVIFDDIVPCLSRVTWTEIMTRSGTNALYAEPKNGGHYAALLLAFASSQVDTMHHFFLALVSSHLAEN